MSSNYNCLVVLGPTASGKTRLAVDLALRVNGAVISADSRQVYQQLDIGTGKDLHEFKRAEKNVPYYLIDLVPPGQQFFLHEFVAELDAAFIHIQSLQQTPIICGGTGLYLDAIARDYRYTSVQENAALRQELSALSKQDLQTRLSQYPEHLQQHVDLHSIKRLIRGIEVAEYLSSNNLPDLPPRPNYKPLYIGITTTVEQRRARIHERLITRLKNGMIEEAEQLLANGMSHERLQRLGLEYKFLSLYLLGAIDQTQLISELETAIIQYAKRQMTWFRKMERSGITIHWHSAEHPLTSILERFQF